MQGMGFLQMLMSAMNPPGQSGPTDAPGAAPPSAPPPEPLGMAGGGLAGGGNLGGGGMGAAGASAPSLFSKPVAGAMGAAGDALMTSPSSTQKSAAPGVTPQARPMSPFQAPQFSPPGGGGAGGPLMGGSDIYSRLQQGPPKYIPPSGQPASPFQSSDIHRRLQQGPPKYIPHGLDPFNR